MVGCRLIGREGTANVDNGTRVGSISPSRMEPAESQSSYPVSSASTQLNQVTLAFAKWVKNELAPSARYR